MTGTDTTNVILACISHISGKAVHHSPGRLWRRPLLQVVDHDGKSIVNNNHNHNGGIMFKWAIIFLVVALIAAVFGFTGIAGAATNIAWILFVLGIILFVVFLVVGRGSARRP